MQYHTEQRSGSHLHSLQPRSLCTLGKRGPDQPCGEKVVFL